MDGTVQVFADRPYRESGTVPLQAFMDAWAEGSDSFKNDPPNAAVLGSADGTTATLIVELGEPQLSDDGISYPFELIDGDVSTVLEDAVIVIDGIDWSHFACCIGY